MKRKRRSKRIYADCFACGDVFELSTSSEMDFFYKQSVRLRAPNYIKEIEKEEKPQKRIKDSQIRKLAGIDFSDFDIPTLSPEQFKRNICEILCMLKHRK